jgi:pantetheine-phosphate adenylyltransferase
MAKAIFAGTFDPVHNGHLDIIERAHHFFDPLVIAIAPSHPKGTLFTLEERLEMLREQTVQLKGVSVASFSGLLVDFARAQGISVVIRGVRAVSDFDYEFSMALMNRKLSEGFETVFFIPSGRYIFLNATLIREVARLGGPTEGLVPDGVVRRLRAKFAASG